MDAFSLEEYYSPIQSLELPASLDLSQLVPVPPLEPADGGAAWSPPDLPVPSTSRASAAPNSAATPDAPQSGSEIGPKRKPKQAACSACRYRRTKCVRSSAAETCNSCLKKKIACVTDPGKPYPQRSGKRIEAARERYGPLPDNQGSTLSSLSHFSMESNLGRQELNESLLSSLVDLCYAPDSSPIPVIKWGNLRKRFEQAGRRLHQLDSVAEPLVRCVMVMGALNSDAPALVGPGGASLDQLPFVRSTEELVRVGKHRHSVAAKLLEETEKCYDQKGLWRQSSPEAIAALTMMSHVQQLFYAGFAHKSPGRRPYIRAATAAIQEGEEELMTATEHFTKSRNTLNHMASYLLVLDDAMKSLADGTPLKIHEADMPLFVATRFLKHYDATAQPKEVLQTVFPIEGFRWMSLGGYAWGKTVKLARQMAKDVSEPVMKGQLPTTDVGKLLAFYTSHEEWLSNAIAQLQGMKDVQSIQRAQISLMGLDMISHLEHAWYTLSVIPLGLRGVYDSALRTSPSMGVNDYTENLRVKSRLDGLVLSMARKTSNRLANARPVEFLGCLRPSNFASSCFVPFCEALLSSPSCDLGGDPAFSHEDKIREAKVMVDIVRMRSWSWPWYGEVADKLEKQLEQLQAPTSSPQLFELAGDTGVSLSDFTWPDLFPPFPGIACDPNFFDLAQ